MLLRLSRALLWLSEFASDVSVWWETGHSWSDMRAARRLPPTSEFQHLDTSDRPFGLPPDVEQPRRK